MSGSADRPAHHAPDGTFRNPWPDSEPRRLRDVLRWMRQRRGAARAPTPARDSFPMVRPTLAHPAVGAGRRTATWMGHSSVLLQAGEVNVLLDPVWSERASPVQWAGPRRVMSPPTPLESLPPLQLIAISHSHYDHLDAGTVRRLARLHPDATWIAPLGLARYLRGFGARSVVELDWWERTVEHGVAITATPARHFSARRIGDRNRTLWCGYALEHEGARAWFAADTAYHPEFGRIGERCGPFGLIMMPIGAYDPRWFMHVVHVDPTEAVQAVADASRGAAPPLTLGIHWGTFRLTDEPMDEPPRRAREEWTKRGWPGEQLWIAACGETRAW